VICLSWFVSEAVENVNLTRWATVRLTKPKIAMLEDAAVLMLLHISSQENCLKTLKREACASSGPGKLAEFDIGLPIHAESAIRHQPIQWRIATLGSALVCSSISVSCPSALGQHRMLIP
jgi:hypothetical protein